MKNFLPHILKIPLIAIFIFSVTGLPAVSPVQKQEKESVKTEQFGKKAEQKSLSLKEKIAIKLLKKKVNRIQKRNAKAEEKKPTQSIAVLSLTLALLGITTIPFSFYPVATIAMLAALIASIISLVKFKKNPGKFRGKKAAIAGVIISSLFIALLLYALVSL